MPTVKIQTGLRLYPQFYGKIKTLAIQDGRSVNNLIEQILRRYVEEHERDHGPIQSSEE